MPGPVPGGAGGGRGRRAWSCGHCARNREQWQETRAVLLTIGGPRRGMHGAKTRAVLSDPTKETPRCTHRPTPRHRHPTPLPPATSSRAGSPASLQPAIVPPDPARASASGARASCGCGAAPAASGARSRSTSSTHEGRRYLVAPRGDTQWVRNLRVAGSGELRVGRRVEAFRATEIDDEDKVDILRGVPAALEDGSRRVLRGRRPRRDRRRAARDRRPAPGFPGRRRGISRARAPRVEIARRHDPAATAVGFRPHRGR